MRTQRIRVRLDDVLIKSDSFKGKEFNRFKHLHEMICKSKFFYSSPNILVKDIQQFPDIIAYLQNEAIECRVELDLHGYEHNPKTPDGRNAYSSMSANQIIEHLDKAHEWWYATFPDRMPQRWVTPHGGSSEAMEYAARCFGLTVETTEYPVIDQREAWGLVNKHHTADFLDHRIIMNHWWEKGHALERIMLVKDYGWELATKKQPNLF